MKKAFEFLLMLIIFYGAFDKAALVVAPNANTVWIVIIALVVAAGFLVLYSHIISSNEKHKLNDKIHELEGNLKTKDQEVKDAFKTKKAVEQEAEKTIPKENTEI